MSLLFCLQLSPCPSPSHVLAKNRHPHRFGSSRRGWSENATLLPVWEQRDFSQQVRIRKPSEMHQCQSDNVSVSTRTVHKQMLVLVIIMDAFSNCQTGNSVFVSFKVFLPFSHQQIAEGRPLFFFCPPLSPGPPRQFSQRDSRDLLLPGGRDVPQPRFSHQLPLRPPGLHEESLLQHRHHVSKRNKFVESHTNQFAQVSVMWATGLTWTRGTCRKQNFGICKCIIKTRLFSLGKKKRTTCVTSPRRSGTSNKLEEHQLRHSLIP